MTFEEKITWHKVKIRPTTDEERANKLKRSIELNELEYPYDLQKYLHPPVPPMDGDFEEVE